MIHLSCFFRLLFHLIFTCVFLFRAKNSSLFVFLFLRDLFCLIFDIKGRKIERPSIDQTLLHTICHCVDAGMELLSIVKPNNEVEINEDKLKRIVSQQKIWDFFGITSQQYSQLFLQKKTTILRKYYSANLNNCGDGKLFFLALWQVFGYCML